jgi:hypothetical protein
VKGELISGMCAPARYYKNMQVQAAVNGTKKNKYDQRNKKNKPRAASKDGLLLLYLKLAS